MRLTKSRNGQTVHFEKKLIRCFLQRLPTTEKHWTKQSRTENLKVKKESKELLDRKDQPVLPEHRDHREFRDLLGQREKHLKSQKLMNL